MRKAVKHVRKAIKHVKKVKKYVRKAIKPHVKKPQSLLFEKGVLEKDFFALLKIVYKDIVKAFSKRKAPEANANFCVSKS